MSDSQDALLMPRADDGLNDDGLNDDSSSLENARTGKVEEGRPSLFVWALTVAAGISGLLFGYDTGVISATLVSIDTSLSNRPLTSFDKSIITSSTALFALLFSPLSSILADRLGRKRVILFADILFTIGALIQALSSTVSGMVIGRCVVGAGVGAASFVVPLYIAEMAPAAFRGMLVTTNILFITLGQVFAYIIGWLFAEYAARETGWRWMVGLGAAPSVMQALVLGFMPETPRWLVMRGFSEEAKGVVQKVSGGGLAMGRMADAVVKEIEVEVREEQVARRLRGAGVEDGEGLLAGFRELVRVRRNRRALAIACLLQGLQQLCGFNSLMYFSATIFTMVGFSVPTLTSLSVAGTNFAFTVMAILLIDKIGRRRMLLYSVPFMIIGLLFAAYGFTYISLPSSSDLPSPTTLDTTTDPSPTSPDREAALMILVSIMLYVASYALGLGNVPWMQSELFPLSVRSLGSGVATSTNWAANFIVGLTFLPLMDALSPARTFVLYALVCAVGYGLVWGWYPETAGLSLEETAALLEDGW
ncbi:Myo-inositol transporter 1 [Scedosporium apiospermum]|uniref:Myo-inositol transporter 1 n=1 Tax=Pseudallescheria apiosperma TaxID=563466 RepID=A0A084GFU3_PSEDA|nr:Myo-inositol transporter 1 [Scedosporium apiospermum]KEZ46205.1 Myo-inositol transporter 1 [Scedosporium apiospermum]